MKRATLIYGGVLSLVMAAVAHGEIITFEEFGLPPDSFDNGHPSGPNHADATGLPLGSYNGSFSVPGSGVTFNNTFDVMDFGSGPIGFWNGIALSSKTDTVTPGFPNQFSAIPGSGAGGSATYGVVFDGATIDLAAPTIVEGFDLTNTVYAYRAIEDGDTGGAFDPPPFEAGDFFKVIVSGYDAQGGLLGTVDFLLSDYLSDNPADHGTVDDWRWLSLTSLGEVSSLGFSFDGSDQDPFYGLNTPAYVAIDNFGVATVPEPASYVLAIGAIFLLLLVRRRLPA